MHMMTQLRGSFLTWVRNTRASVSVEFVVGAVLIVTATVGGLDLYRLVDARSVGLRAAATMADYVALETDPNLQFIEDLAKYLNKHEIAMPSDAAFVISAVNKPGATEDEDDPPAVVSWSRKIVVSDMSTPSSDLGNCGRIGGKGDEATLPAVLAMEPGEDIVVAEVCVKLLPTAFVSGGVLPADLLPSLLYRQQIRPMRAGTLPKEPI